MKINRYLDYAVLKPEMTQQETREAIQLGLEYDVATICIHPRDIELAKEMCKGTNTEVICVLDFPHGCATAAAKEALAGIYADQGVAEIDMVMNYGYARSGMWDEVEDEVRRVVRQAHARNVLVKVIFETSQLTVEEIKKGVEVCIKAGADYVKTSTGFYGEGATMTSVGAMIEAAQGRIKVKPSGGIREKAVAEKFIEMGADRIGAGAASVAALCGEKK